MKLLKMGRAVWKLWHVVRILVLWYFAFDKAGFPYFLEQLFTLAGGHIIDFNFNTMSETVSKEPKAHAIEAPKIDML